ncbi:hypothetical protein [Algoriphagus namhaensis]
MKQKIYRPVVLFTVISSLLITFFVPGLASGFLSLGLRSSEPTATSAHLDRNHEGSFILKAEQATAQPQFLLSLESENVEDAEESEIGLQLKQALVSLFVSLLVFALGLYRLRFINFYKNYFSKLQVRLHSYLCVYVI